MSFRNTILKAWFSRRARAIDRFRRHPIETQERMFRYLLRRGRMTEFGDRYDLRHIHTVEQFQTQVETFDYDTFKPYVERMLEGIRSVTSPGRVTLFARSSGTTSDRSKYIPVTRDSLWWNHTLGMRDVATLYAAAHPKTRAFEGKTLTAGGLLYAGGAQPGRRPLGAADPRDDLLERLVPRPAHRDGHHPRLRRQVRGHLPRVRRRAGYGLCRRSVVEPGVDAPRARVYRAAEPA